MNRMPRKLFIGEALQLVFRGKSLLAIFILLSLGVSILYLFLLPSLPDGAFSFVAIRFITPLQVLFSLVFGTLLSLVVVLNIFAYKLRASAAKKMSVSAILASLVNGLCCTPAIPSIIALTGVSTPVLFEYSTPMEAFFENYYPYFYLVSSVLILLSIHYLTKSIICCPRKI